MAFPISPKINDNSQIEIQADNNRNLFLLAIRRLFQHKPAVISMIVLILEISMAIAAPILIREELAIRPQPLIIHQKPSAAHWLGTDEIGRDILARLIYASRISLSVASLAALFAVSIGTLFGSLAGYYGGWLDNILMRFTDAVMSVPVLFITIVLAVIFGQNVGTLILVIGGLSWMQLARIVRANFLSLKETEFVQAARLVGSTDLKIISQHIIPNTIAPIVVACTLGVGNALMTEAGVSYLGLGVQPPTPSWGNMLYNAQSYLWEAPWIALYPGFFILVTVLCINFIGDGLRDALDPRMTM